MTSDKPTSSAPNAATVGSDLTAEASALAHAVGKQDLSGMSHELRTPLNAIIGYSELLIDQAADTGRQEMVADLEKIRDAGRHLLSVIERLLDRADDPTDEDTSGS